MELYGGGTIRGTPAAVRVFRRDLGFILMDLPEPDHHYLESGDEDVERALNALHGTSPEGLSALDLYLEDNEMNTVDPRKFRVVLHEGTIYVIDAVEVYLLPPDAEMLKKDLWGEGGKRVLDQLEL